MSWTVLPYGSSGLRPADASDPLSNSYSLLYGNSSYDSSLSSLGIEDPDAYLRFAKSVIQEDPPEIPYQRQLISDNYRRRVTQLYTQGTPIPNHSGMLNTDIHVDARPSAMYEKMRRFDAAWMPRLVKFGDNMVVDSSGQESRLERIEAERFVPQNIRLPEDNKVARPMGYSGNRFHNPQGLSASTPTIDLAQTDLTNALTGNPADLRARAQEQRTRGLSERAVQAPGYAGEQVSSVGRQVAVSGRANRSASVAPCDHRHDSLRTDPSAVAQAKHQRVHSLLLAEQAALADSVQGAQVGNHARRVQQGSHSNAARYATGSLSGGVSELSQEAFGSAARLGPSGSAALRPSSANTAGRGGDLERAVGARALVHGSPASKIGLDRFGPGQEPARSTEPLVATSRAMSVTHADAARSRDRLQTAARSTHSTSDSPAVRLSLSQKAKGSSNRSRSELTTQSRSMADSQPSAAVQSDSLQVGSGGNQLNSARSASSLQRVDSEPFSATPFFYDYSFSNPPLDAKRLSVANHANGDRPPAEFARTDADNYRASVRLDRVYTPE